MRLDFNVLWVEDQPDHVRAQIDAIKRQMREQGFEFNPKVCRSLEEVRGHLTGDVFIDEVDLILVDWDLGESSRGQDAIAEIREIIPYKDVVFYSALTNAEQLRDLAHSRRLEGVYCASRNDLVGEVIGVFESLVKKVLDLDHTRGIVMGATSDIDFMVGECIDAMNGRLDEAGQQVVLQSALKRVTEKVTDFNKRGEQLLGADNLTAVMAAHAIFTAYDKLRLLSSLLKHPAFAEQRDYRTSVVNYMEQVVPDRNILGHQVLAPEGKPPAVVDARGATKGIDEMRDLRCLLLGLRGEFRSLLSSLAARI